MSLSIWQQQPDAPEFYSVKVWAEKARAAKFRKADEVQFAIDQLELLYTR